MAFADELALMDGMALAQLVRRREASPLELVNAVIARIERLNPTLNAVVTPMYEQARAAAAGSLPDGPFTGVPFLLKDLLAACAGVRMTSGSRLLANFVPDHDSELVKRLKRAGLIMVGKTNTPEFGLVPTTEPELFGPCRNPWNVKRTAGGSSGGAAAAVAAALVPMAHGGDGGGSIRIPASCCGVFGLKPTRARNPLGPDYGDIKNGWVVEHALTRSVRDSAALLDATCGPDTGDPYWAPPRERPFLQEVGASPGRLRVAYFSMRPDGAALHPDCVAAVREAAALCTDLGHEVVEASPVIDWQSLTELFTRSWAVGCASILDGIAQRTGQAPRPDEVEPLTWALYQIGRREDASNYLLAVRYFQAVAREVARFFTHHDLWLTPVLAEPPVPLGAFSGTREDPMRGLQRAAEFSPFTPLANITGQPAMSVPLHWNADGLPIGTHFMARFGDEATLFRLAAQLEQARPWASRLPAMAGA